MNKILITGATGHIGGAVIETLLTNISSNQISIITQNEEKRLEFQLKDFNAFLGSYDNIVALEKTMHGVNKVLLISSGDQGERI